MGKNRAWNNQMLGSLAVSATILCHENDRDATERVNPGVPF